MFSETGHMANRTLLVIILMFICAQGMFIVSGGVIQGCVTENGTGQAIGDLRIRVYDINWQIRLSGCTWTAGDGTYSTGDMPAGSYYIRAVSNYPQPWVTQYWYQSSERSTAIPVHVASGEPIIGIDFVLDRGGYLSGTIQDDSGYPLVDLDLDLYTSEWVFDTRYSARTDETGRYLLGPIPPGRWYLRADPDPYHGVCQQYWPQAWYRENAVILVLEEAQDLQGVDFTLYSGGAVSGQVLEVRNQTGRPDCEVYAYSMDGIRQPIHGALSGEDGSYLAYGLPEGSYFIGVEPPKGCGAAEAYYPDAGTMQDAVPIDVTVSQTETGMDVFLAEGNFSLSAELAMPDKSLVPGDLFGLTLSISNKGPLLEDIPVFVILNLHGDMYFWPSWARWAPPQYNGLDFMRRNLPAGSEMIVVFPELPWPEVDTAMSGLEFIAAVTNWSLTDLASDMDVIEWGFGP